MGSDWSVVAHQHDVSGVNIVSVCYPRPPGQDKLALSLPMSGEFSFVVSSELTLSEVGLFEIRKPRAN